jgi:hypothetical protein
MTIGDGIGDETMEMVLEIHVSSVAHALRGLHKKHGSPIPSPWFHLQYNLVSSPIQSRFTTNNLCKISYL